MTKAQEMLAKAGFPDTKQGRAAFHKMYPTSEDFFKVHGDMFKNAPKYISITLPITPENVVLDHSPDRDYYLENTLANSPETDDDTDMYKSGGGIHIKPSKRGTFTAAAKKHGKSVQAFASQVLANKENYSPAMVKKANFARNAAKWKHEDGGPVMYAEGGKLPEGILRSRLEAHMNPSEAQSYINKYAAGSMVGNPPPYTEEEAINNARLSGTYYDRFSNPSFGNKGPGSYAYYMDRLKNRNVKTVNPNAGVKDAPVNMHTITGSCEAGNCYEFEDGGVVDAYQLMGMPTPPMYNYGSHITHYTPSFNFGHVQSANNTYRHGFGYGGPIGKYDFGSTIKTIGAAAYGAGEGLLDTVTMGATDQLTDAGYDALQKAGGSSEAEKHKQNAWHGGFQTAGAVTGAVFNPASLGSAITEGSEGVGEVIGEASPNSEKAQKWRQGITMAGGIAGMATGMGAFGTPGGSAAGLTKTQNFYNTGLGNFAGKTSKIGQGFNAVSSGNPMAMLGAFGGMGGIGGMGGGSNMGTTGTSNFSPDPNQYMNQGINFNYSSPSFGHAMGGAVNAPNMMQYADGGLLGMGGINKFSGLFADGGLLGLGGVNKFSGLMPFADGGLLGMGGINKFSNMFADGGFLNKAGTAGIMGLGPALLAGKMADGGLLGLGGVNKFSGLFGDGGFLGTMIPLAKPFMADGGNTPATEINVEGNELLTDENGNILTEYGSNALPPHPADGSMDPRGTVPAQEGQFVITKRLAPKYKAAMKNNDKLYADAMRNNIAFDKQRKEAKQQAEQEMLGEMMRAQLGGLVGQYGYGGGVMKYDGGSNINFSNPYGLWNNSMSAGIQPGMQAIQNANQGLPGFDLQNFLNLNGLEGADLNPESVRFMMNNQNLNNRQPITPIFGPGYNDPNANEYTGLDQLSDNPDQIPYRQDLGDKWGYTPNNNYGTSQFVPHYLPTMPSGADRAMDAATQDLVGLPSQKDLNLNNELKSIGPKVPIGDPKLTLADRWALQDKNKLLDYLPMATNAALGLEAILQKPFNMNAEDYMIKSKLNPYEEQYRPDYRAYNAALYSTRSNPNLAARTELFNRAQQAFADEKYKVNQANLARKMQADQYNIGLEGQNLSTRMNIAQFNEQNRAARRNAIREQFGKNLPADIYNYQTNQMSKEALSAAYPDYQFSWNKRKV